MQIKIFFILLLLIICEIVNTQDVSAQDLKNIKLKTVSLENDLPLLQALQKRKSSREFSEKELTIQHLSNILWCANGINRPKTGHRTSPSAMNKQDIDIYLILREGAYLFDAKNLELIQVAAGDFRKDAGMQPWVGSAPLNLIYVSDTSKFSPHRDRERTLLAAAFDAGHCSQNVYLYCASANLAVVTRASIDKKKIEGILKLKSQQVIMLAQTVGYPK